MKKNNYLHLAESKEDAIIYWNNSQYDLADIVLFLTDHKIKIGIKIYALFSRPETKYLMQFFCCDFLKIKEQIGVDKYIERYEDIYSKNFNPKRLKHHHQLSLSELKAAAYKIYADLLNDLKTITEEYSYYKNN